ncbi:MAG: hypothetical protein AB1643_02610 [Patescibacteria group bacterium]
MAGNTSIDQIISTLNTSVFNPLILLMIAIALAVFIWGVIEFIAGADNEQQRVKGKRHIIWGLIGLTIVIGVKGIIDIVLNFVTSW